MRSPVFLWSGAALCTFCFPDWASLLALGNLLPAANTSPVRAACWHVAVHGAVPDVGFHVAYWAFCPRLLVPQALSFVRALLSKTRRDEGARVRAGSWRARPTEDVTVGFHESGKIHIDRVQIRVQKLGGDLIPICILAPAGQGTWRPAIPSPCHWQLVAAGRGGQTRQWIPMKQGPR